MADFIPYAELTPEQKALVDSVDHDIRFVAVEEGLGWDKLVDDPSWEVRQCVAFRDYGLDQLVDDPDPRVRFAVAKRDFGLDKLIDDPDEDVRLVVACKINEPERFAVDPDKFVNVFSPFGRKGPTLEEWIALNPDKCALPENKPASKQEVHDKVLLAEYQAVMVDICRSLGAEPKVDISDPTYYQEVIDNAVAGLREPSLKNAVVLKQAGNDALLFTGNNVEPFVVALGYDPERKDWSAGTYYADLRQAVCDFDRQFGTLAYSYNLSLEDLYPLLEEKGFESTHENVRTLMLNTNDFEDVSEYINESLTRLFDDEIDSCEEVLEQSPVKPMPEKSFHARSVEEIAGAIATDLAEEQQDLTKFNELLAARGSKAIFVDLPTKDTIWGVLELEVILNDGSKEYKEYVLAFYDHYARGVEEDCYEPFQADFDKACEELKALHAVDPRYVNATIEANDWMDPAEAEARIFELDAEALRVIRDIDNGLMPFVDEEKRRYHLISQAEVDSVVEKHQNGLKDLPDAQVANFSADDLSYFDLSNLDLGTINNIGKEVCDPVSFEEANLTYTDLSYDELKGANFRKSFIYGTDYRESNLEGCDFSGAILEKVDFTNALMKDTIFDETTIRDMILPNGEMLVFVDPADSLAVMERLTKPKQEKHARATSLDELASQAREKADQRNSQLQDDRMPNSQKRSR
jgi:hypothetical protein